MSDDLCMTGRDYITVLTVRSPAGAMMTKRLFRATNGAIGKTGYDKAYKFDVRKIGLNDLADLAEVLFDLRSRPNKVVIRGEPVGGHYDVRRTLEMFHPGEHHWVFLDFDDVPLPLCIHPDDPDIALGYLVRLLPESFHDASYYWQWSCGHGINRDSLRAHLFFWCATKHSDKEYENWAKWINGEANEKLLDPSVFRTVQPNYTSAPLIAKDVLDPVDPELRCGLFIGAKDEVSITIPDETWEDHVKQLERDEYLELAEFGLRAPYVATSEVVGSSTVRYLDYLIRVGDDLDGFHDPITKSIWYWAKEYSEATDEDFKEALRYVIRTAKCTKQRDLDHYLSDYYIDSSLRGARAKAKDKTPLDHVQNKLNWNKQRNQKLVEDDVAESLEAIRRMCM